MKSTAKKILLFSIAMASIYAIRFISDQDERSVYESYLNTHEYLNRDVSVVSKMLKQDRPDLAWEQDFIRTMDPKTKRPERERLLPTYLSQKQQGSELASIPGQSESPWVERGPSNVGGRTRGLVYDPNVANKVWAGSVSGGLWYNNDITDANTSWQSVDDFWDNLAITAIAFDPNNSLTIYVGTGEGWFNADAVRGAGIWKSVDGGTFWDQLSATTNYQYVHDLVVRDESSGASSGVLYVGTSNSGAGSEGMHVSSDGGASFTTVASFKPTDICLAADNRIWVGTNDGRVMYSDDGISWVESHDSGFGRVAIACAPSNPNYVYALIEGSSVVQTIVYTDDQGANWNAANEPVDVDNGIPDDDFSRGQAWYDLVIAVDPNDENTVVVGAVDLFRSTDNGTNWNHISKWSNNANLNTLNVSLVHADQHAITYKGAGSNEVLFGTDGGVYYSPDLTNAAIQDMIFSRNLNYNTTQFYAGAIHPTAGRDFFLAGAQDNGSQRFDNAGINATVEVTGGDGAFCFIDQTDPNFQITSFVFNVYFRSTNEGNSFSTIQSDQSTGSFINPTDYDDNLDILYSTRDANSINRISGISGTPLIESVPISLVSKSSHIRVSPYTTTSTTLFTGTLSGRLFKILNADGSSPGVSDITGGTFPTGSISCVEIGASEDELLVTFSNYGVTSVWYTNDGGANWENKEGSLPDMPVRWALFNPNNRSEVILATELGVWRTTNIGSTSPTWTASNSGLANVRVDMLQTRTSDNEVIAATHGRGVFSSNGFQVEASPSVDFVADVTVGCGSSLSVNFTNLTSSNPAATAYQWSFAGGTPATSTLQTPPAVVYNSSGSYDVTLSVTNAIGQSTETKPAYINLGTAAGLPFSEGFESATFPPDCWVSFRGLNGLGIALDWERSTADAQSGSASAYVQFENVTGGIAEDWLVSPEIDLSSSLNNTLSFFMRQTYSPDFGSIYRIKVSTTSQTDLASFSEVVSYIESDFSDSFSQFSVDLSAYTGQEVYLAFVMEQDDGDDWYLDDISITGTSIAITADNGFAYCSDESTTLSVTDDAGFSYQWLLNDQAISGATAFGFSPTESGDYTVAVTDNGVTLESEAVTVTIFDLPVLNSQSSSTTACTTENIALTVNAAGTSLTYQWRLDGTDLTDDSQISGSTTATLAVADLEASDAGNYSCLISNANCSITSVDLVLTLVGFAQISTQPVTQLVCEEDFVSFTVTATGSNLTYQWHLNGDPLTDGGDISGANAATLSIASVAQSDAGDYYCEIGSDCSNALMSDEVALTTEICLGLAEDLANQLRLFPNPTKGAVNFDFGSMMNASHPKITVFDLSGQMVLSKSLVGAGNGQIDFSGFPKGVYLININVDEIDVVKRVVKK